MVRSGIWSHSRWRVVLAAVLAFSVLLGQAAFADDIVNDLDNTVDSDLESMSLSAGGAAGGVTFRVVNRNDDGKPGCNLTGGSQVVFAVESSDAAVAAVSPSTLTFTSCGDQLTVNVTPHAPGTADVTLRETSNTTDGSFNAAPAAFRVTVSSTCPAAPTTAPTIAMTGAPAVETGWFNATTGPAAFTVSPGADAEYSLDGGATWSTYAGAVTTLDGTHEVTARNVRPASVGCARVEGPAAALTTVRQDTVAPVVGVSVSPEANVNGWNNSLVTEDWTCTDGGSGIAVCPEDGTHGHGSQVAAGSFTATDVAGNVSAPVQRRAIDVDTVAPVLSAAVSPDANDDGWNNTLVSAAWTCEDALSGVVADDCPGDEMFEDDAVSSARTVTVSDLAGNSTTHVRREVKVDATAPSVVVAVTPAPTNGWNNEPVEATYECDGSISGLRTPCPADETFSVEGSYEARTVTVTDNADNVSNPAVRREVKIDTTGPEVDVLIREGDAQGPEATAVNGWYSTELYVDYTCTDEVSGGVASGVVTCPDDYTIDTDGTHDEVSYTVSDQAGNTTSGEVPEIKLDTTAPVLSVTGVAPGATYVLGDVPTVGCSIEDQAGGSGVDEAVVVSSSVAGGNESGVGSFTATCSGGADLAGNPSASVSVTYTVGYRLPSFLPPIKEGGPNVFKRNSTVPVKFQLLDSAGRPIPDADARALVDTCSVRLSSIEAPASASDASELLSNSNPANTGDCFRYDADTDQFVFNLGTKQMKADAYHLVARVTGGGAVVATHSVAISLR